MDEGQIARQRAAEEQRGRIAQLSAAIARAEAAEKRNARLREALEEIARQKRTDELETDADVEFADFEGGYDMCIDRARSALRAQPGEDSPPDER